MSQTLHQIYQSKAIVVTRTMVIKFHKIAEAINADVRRQGYEVDENNPVIVTPDFTQGTNATVYKLKDVFNPTTPGGGPNTGTVPVVSKSLTWEAIPQINSNGNVDIWMKNGAARLIFINFIWNSCVKNSSCKSNTSPI